MIIKHIENLTDRATILHIQENMFMQYFLGYSSFTNEAPFTAPLFVAIRKRMSLELTTKISEVIALHCVEDQGPEELSNKDPDPPQSTSEPESEEQEVAAPAVTEPVVTAVLPPQGKLIIDATVAPQNITYPTDLKLLSAARRKSEQLIDLLYDPALHGSIKPRTYRNIAQKLFLNTAKKKVKSNKGIPPSKYIFPDPLLRFNFAVAYSYAATGL